MLFKADAMGVVIGRCITFLGGAMCTSILYNAVPVPAVRGALFCFAVPHNTVPLPVPRYDVRRTAFYVNARYATDTQIETIRLSM